MSVTERLHRMLCTDPSVQPQFMTTVGVTSSGAMLTGSGTWIAGVPSAVSGTVPSSPGIMAQINNSSNQSTYKPLTISGLEEVIKKLEAKQKEVEMESWFGSWKRKGLAMIGK
jgi:hypothetical protein